MINRQVVVIGAGAAGLLAATRAAQRGRSVLLVEKNTKPGVKILMSGGTRCNLTHATDRRGIGDAFPLHQSRFLRGPLAALGPEELVELFHAEGLPTKVESTGKVFPKSDRALDVQRMLLRMLERSGAELSLREGVESIEPTSGGFRIVTTQRTIEAEKVILATGGQSYPGCGTTGDGYAWAKQLGHSIVPPRPALVPVRGTDPWAQALSGVTLPDVELAVVAPGAKKPLARKRGSLLFTHFGFSGPVVMDVSRTITEHPKNAELSLACDFLPDKTEQQLIESLQNLAGNKQVASLVNGWLPKRIAEALLERSDVPPGQTAAELSKRQRNSLVASLKRCPFGLAGSLGFSKAEVTAGGVSLKEVDSRTMESKQTAGLYLIGEVLDIDGPIGGYNFQAAFSTGWLAGESV